MGNVGIYSVGRDLMYQIWQIGKTECFVGISREGLTRETFAKTAIIICHDSSHSSHVLSTCFTLREGFSRATYKNFFSLQFALSFHTLSYTQPLQRNPTQNTGYKRLNKITIKFGMKLKPTQNSWKSQLYSPFGYSVTKPLKQTLDLNISLRIMAKLTYT